MKRVVVGLSGGVDSSVTALLLKEQGYEVIGMFMRNWHDESVTLSDDCPWIDDSNDALLIAQQLDIPFQVIDLSKEYKERIVDYMFDEYKNGRTPNPDVLCNREIKFDVFLKAALELNADYVATGHYCRKIEHEDGSFGLLAGLDKNKDQSYFLCQLNQEQLSKALFPIGELQKDEVRKIALENDLVTAEKKDSQGLCFVGKISLPTFLQQKLSPIKGDIVEIPDDLEQFNVYNAIEPVEKNVVELAKPFSYSPEMGEVVASHQGAHYYTIGQRRGLHIGGRPFPSFVIGLDIASNTVYSGMTDLHPGLNRYALKINLEDVHFVSSKFSLNNIDGLEADIRIRYRQAYQKGILHLKSDGLYVLFKEKQRGITPGQFAAFYVEGELVASGVIC
ncbi:MAG: tRNA 2-thiouridine(34) synthase MnmA [Fluviicola sp.]|nr:tRNA 2-thiouridine(34) synthase MnmA [Fluviicola sp.]